MFDIAVIGAGRIGQIHARNVAAHAGARLVGMCDPDFASAEPLAALCGSRVIGLDAAFAAAESLRSGRAVRPAGLG